MKGRLVKEQQRLAGMQRSREAFLAVWQANRSRARALRTMQRHIQARTIRRLQRTNKVNRQANRYRLLILDTLLIHAACKMAKICPRVM